MQPAPFASLALAAALLAGCARTLPLEEAGGPPIRTDRAEYTVTRNGPLLETRIGMTYTNSTGGTVYLPTCQGVQPPALEKRVGDRWVTAYAPVHLLCLGPPVVLRPGESHEYAFRVAAGLPGTNFSPKFEVEEVPGTYRLVWAVFSRWNPDAPGPGPQLPLEQRVSNPFTLRVE